MDPLDPASFRHRFARVNGINLHYVNEGSGPKTIICVHGFPDLWYGWRYQIPYLVKLGYRVIVPDVRGYGQTDAPAGIANYTSKTIVKDLVGLLDFLNIRDAVWVGHDWGAWMVWRAALWHPERVRAVAAYCVSYTPTMSRHIPLEQVAKRRPNWKYQVYFSKESTTAELNAEIPLFLTTILRSHRDAMYTSVFSESVPTDKRSITDARGAQRSEMLAESELGYHISEYQRHGMEGPLNYYRVHELNWQEENSAGFKLDRIHKPCLMVTAGKDKALPAAWTKDMDKYIPNLMRVHIEDSGHWIMIEQKELANKALGEFLATLDHTSAKL